MKRTRQKVRAMGMVAILGMAVAASGQGLPPGAAKPPRWPARSRTEITLTIAAQAPGKPALAFGLMPSPEETVQGNGAMKYLEATAQLPQLTSEEQDLMDSARSDAPLAELDENDGQLKAIRGKFDFTLKLLREGARMDSTDWGTGAAMRQRGLQALLPSLGRFRQASNALALEIRFEIKKHAWAAARDKLETGYQLAHAMTGGDTLIESLVGLALAGQMDKCVEDWVSEPGSPNLYWPLTNLPVPFANMSNPLGYERAMAYFSIPEFREIKSGRYSPELWTGLVARTLDVSQMASSVEGAGGLPGGTGLEPWKRQVMATGFAAVLYPQAKQYFREQGMAAEAVEKMPVAEAVGRYFVETYDAEADEVFKWKGLSAHEASLGMRETEKAMATRDPTAGNMLARIMLPSLGRAMTVSARGDRQIAMLRVVEAIRAYAAEKGALPGKLEDLTLPVPRDPTTGEAFEFQQQGDAVILNSSSSEKNGALRYEIRLRK